MHELLRQFAAEQLAQSPAAQAAVLNRHAAYYLAWVVEQMQCPASPLRTERLALETENMRAAWRWAVQQHDVALLALAIELEAVVLAQTFVPHTGFFHQFMADAVLGCAQVAPELVEAARRRGNAREILATIVELLAAERAASPNVEGATAPA